MSDNGREEESTRERAAGEDDNKKDDRTRGTGDGDRSRAAPGEEPQTNSLILRELSNRVRVEDVRELFEKYGSVKDGKLLSHVIVLLVLSKNLLITSFLVSLSLF